MAENLLSEKMDLVELKMNEFFSSAEKAFIISYKRRRSRAYQTRDIKALNRQFIPILEGFEAISGVGLGDEFGNYYLLEQREGLYENMIVKPMEISKNPPMPSIFDKDGSSME